jgi:hypothetical protein
MGVTLAPVTCDGPVWAGCCPLPSGGPSDGLRQLSGSAACHVGLAQRVWLQMVLVADVESDVDRVLTILQCRYAVFIAAGQTSL